MIINFRNSKEYEIVVDETHGVYTFHCARLHNLHLKGSCRDIEECREQECCNGCLGSDPNMKKFFESNSRCFLCDAAYEFGSFLLTLQLIRVAVLDPQKGFLCFDCFNADMGLGDIYWGN